MSFVLSVFLFFKKFFQLYDRSVKQFRAISGPTFVGADLGPNCLQGLTTDGTGNSRKL